MVRHSPEVGELISDVRQIRVRTYFLVAWGRSSSWWVLVWNAMVWPEGSTTEPLPRRDAGMAETDERNRAGQVRVRGKR
jgi:hypothetical protein